MKTSRFAWQWDDGPVYADPLVTRARAAHLIRCWRRSARQNANHRNVTECLRLAPGVYRAVSSYGEAGTLIVGGV